MSLKLRFLIFTTSLIPSFAMAGDLTTVRAACLTPAKDYSCHFLEADGFPYDPSWTEKNLGRSLFSALQSVSEGFRAIQKMSLQSALPGCGYGMDAGEIILNSLKGELDAYSKTKKLSPCQQACLALCATSNYVEYGCRWSGLHSTARIATDAKGNCADFSAFAVHLLEGFGIDSRKEYARYTKEGEDRAHEWVRLTLNGKRYYAQPQSPSCEFYPAD